MNKKILVIGPGSTSLVGALMRMEKMKAIARIIHSIPDLQEWPAAHATPKPVEKWQGKRRTPWRKRK